MSTRCRNRLVSIAAVSVGACAWLGHSAHAAPPLNKLSVQLAHSTESKAATSAAVRLPQSRLDLAAPALGAPLNERQSAGVYVGASQQRASGSTPATGLPGLGGAPAGRIMSRPEMLVRNFKREGLPVAKLFQSENSLLHVGLSPKGKPGLWFVEKLH